MANIIEDTLDGLKLLFANNLSLITEDDILIGYPDTRLVESKDTTLSIICIGLTEAPERKYSGYFHNVTKDDDAIAAYQADPDTAPIPTAALERLPIPFDLKVQIDSYSRLSAIDWQIQTEIKPLIASNLKVTTPLGNEFYLELEQGDDQDDLLDGDFHKVYRLSVPLWFPNAHAAEQATLAVQTIFELNNDQIVIKE